MNDADITRQMAEYYRQGKSLEDVGKKFGMTRQGVRERFIKAGIERRARDKTKSIDKDRLQALYGAERMRVPDIARLLSVSVKTVNLALEFHQIPKRERLKKGGYIVDFLRALEINEKNILQWNRKNPAEYAHLHSAAKHVGIKISIKAVGGRRYEVTRLK